jgi:phage gp16-like protein
MKPQYAEARRKSELAKIHVAKKELALADDEYRAILLAVTGKTSAADLDWRGRDALLAHFKKIGFKAKGTDRARPNVGEDRMPRMRKIEAQLADAGYPWSYADALAKKICKKDSIRFCDGGELSKIISALARDAARRTMGLKPSRIVSDLDMDAKSHPTKSDRKA